MKHWKQLLLVAAIITGVGATLLPAGNVSAISVLKDQCKTVAGANSSSICKAAAVDDAADMTKKIINTMLYILGILAVVMIIVGGIKYTTSAGDASKVKSAKDTVMYSVVGLVVAILAFAIVNFVVTRF